MNPRSMAAAAKKMLIVLSMFLSFVLYSRTAQCQTYWYETYQRAVELIDKGDSEAATPLIDRLIQDHPVPISGYMLPGERFMDYLPYYQRARIQLKNGDAPGAAHSLDICEAFGAILRNRGSRRDMEKLRHEIAGQADARKLDTADASALASKTAPH